MVEFEAEFREEVCDLSNYEIRDLLQNLYNFQTKSIKIRAKIHVLEELLNERGGSEEDNYD